MDACIVIIGILFWVVTALAAIGILTYVFVCVQYYKWEKDERENDKRMQEIQELIENGKDLFPDHSKDSSE